MVPEAGSLTVLGFDTIRKAAADPGRHRLHAAAFRSLRGSLVQENLDLYADLRGLPKAERPAVFDELLTFTDLKRFTTRLPASSPAA